MTGNDQFGERCNFLRKTLDDTYVTDGPVGENSVSLCLLCGLCMKCIFVCNHIVLELI